MTYIGHMPVKGMNPSAFRGELSCPYCRGSKWKYINSPAQFRFRYQCKSCKKTVIYDASNRPEHPYSAQLKSGRFRDLVTKIKQSI